MIILLPVLAFLFAAALIAVAALALSPNRAVAIDRRLDEVTNFRAREAEGPPRVEALFKMIRKVSEKTPRAPKEMGQLRLRRRQAGYRGEGAMSMFFGIRAALALTLF